MTVQTVIARAYYYTAAGRAAPAFIRIGVSLQRDGETVPPAFTCYTDTAKPGWRYDECSQAVSTYDWTGLQNWVSSAYVDVGGSSYPSWSGSTFSPLNAADLSRSIRHDTNLQRGSFQQHGSACDAQLVLVS